MLVSIFFRLIKFLGMSVLCSLTIYLGVAGVVVDKWVLCLAFIAFVIVICVDAYGFSFRFWEIQHYFIGLLLPLSIYIALGYLTCLIFEPIVFNRIFLPLRFAGAFGMATIESITIIGIALILIVTILRFFGARSGYAFCDMYGVDKDEE